MSKVNAYKIPQTKPVSTVEDFINRGHEPQAYAKPKTSERKTVKALVDGEESRKVTVDISTSLHHRIKMGCAARGLVLTEVLRDFLKKEFPKI